MAFVLEDRVVETANNPGQGDFELLGATSNNRSFVDAIGNGNTTRYLAVGAEGWEIGVAEVSAGSPDRLLRPGTVTKNSDSSTSPINFTGTVTVACIASVEDVLWLGENGDLPARGGRDLGTDGDRWRNAYLRGALFAGLARIISSGQVPLLLDYSGAPDSHQRILDLLREGVSVGDITGRDGVYVQLRGREGCELRFGSGGLDNRARLRTDGVFSVDERIEAKGLPVGMVHTGSASGTVNFPTGHYVVAMHATEEIPRNSAVTVRLHVGAEVSYRLTGSGAVLSGVWRSRGLLVDSANSYLVQRVDV